MGKRAFPFALLVCFADFIFVASTIQSVDVNRSFVTCWDTARNSRRLEGTSYMSYSLPNEYSNEFKVSIVIKDKKILIYRFELNLETFFCVDSPLK